MSQKINLSSISFPSDGLTISGLRKLYPEQFDATESVGFFSKPHGRPAREMVSSLLQMERDLARSSFGHEFGETVEIMYPANDLDGLQEELADIYIEYGIADGPATAGELIRNIRAQAVAQARQHLPPRH